MLLDAQDEAAVRAHADAVAARAASIDICVVMAFGLP
jgi:hypothetical protein